MIIARANQDVPVKSIGAVVQGPPEHRPLPEGEEHHLPGATWWARPSAMRATELSEALVHSIMAYGADSSDVTLIDVGFDLMSSMTTGNVDATIGCLVNHEVPQMEEEGV